MHYFTYDEDGAITGAYIQDLLPEHSERFIEVTPELYAGQAALAPAGATKVIRRIDSGLVVFAGNELALTESFALSPRDRRIDLSTTTANAELVEVAALPDGWRGGLFTFADGVFAPTPEYAAQLAAAAVDALAAAKRDLTLSIDRDADAIRNAVLGGRTTEYQEALADAQAFAAAAYSGIPPPGVKTWLDARNAVGAGWTAQQAADDIIATGAHWKGAQNLIREHRLLRKEQARAAGSIEALAPVRAAWEAFVSQVRSQLGLAD